VAVGATVLCLGLPFVGDQPGRVLGVRVLLVGAIVLITFAVLGSKAQRTREHLVVAAIGLLIFTAALHIRELTPSGVVLLAAAIGGLLWQRRVWVES
jgi:hypothetical protein